MNTKGIKSYTFVVCLALVVIAQGQNNQERETVINGISIGEIRDYRTMFRVNQKPIDILEETKMMCAPPSLVYGPHYDPGVVYYINEIARQGIRTYPDNKLFPLGSIIVKEKQERKTEDSVQIITVMKKVRSGRSENSWEYKMYDTKKWEEIDFSKQRANRSNRTCIECHRPYKDNDYVSDKGIKLLLGKE
ncbi:MAG: cytochrome P460 family protein [Acidobacteriota bacterium]